LDLTDKFSRPLSKSLGAYFAIVEFGNISLTLPPATLRKADPHSPVIRRKIKKTAAVLLKAKRLFLRVNALTDIRGKRHWECEDEE